MKFNNKKGGIEIIGVLWTAVLIGFIIISFLVFIFKISNIDYNYVNKEGLILADKIFINKCFSEKFGVIEKKKFTQNNFDECYKDNKDKLIKIKILEKNFYTNQDDFEYFEISCDSTTCFQNSYLIKYIDEKDFKILNLEFKYIYKK